MKTKTLLILIVAAMMMACNNGETLQDENFTIQVSNIQSRQVSVKVTPSNKKAYYYWDIETAERFTQLKDTIGEYYLHLWEWELEYVKPMEGEGENDEDYRYRILEDYLYKDTDTEPEFDALMPETKYVAFAYYTDENYHAGKITALEFTTANAEILKDMKVWFVPKKDMLNISISLISCDELFFGSVSTKELGSTPIKEYAEKYFSENIATAKTLKPEGLFYITNEPIPEEETEWFACSYFGKSRTSEWFFYHTPAK